MEKKTNAYFYREARRKKSVEVLGKEEECEK
jgi:hypothetical protein